MKDEQIAREIVDEFWPWKGTEEDNENAGLLVIAIAAALATARRAGFDACKEQAASLSDTQRKTWRHSPDAEAACWALEKAIRALEPKT